MLPLGLLLDVEHLVELLEEAVEPLLVTRLKSVHHGYEILGKVGTEATESSEIDGVSVLRACADLSF